MTPSPLFPADVRRELLERCLTGLLTASCDIGLMLPSDWNELEPHWIGRIEPIERDGMVWAVRPRCRGLTFLHTSHLARFLKHIFFICHK